MAVKKTETPFTNLMNLPIRQRKIDQHKEMTLPFRGHEKKAVPNHQNKSIALPLRQGKGPDHHASLSEKPPRSTHQSKSMVFRLRYGKSSSHPTNISIVESDLSAPKSLRDHEAYIAMAGIQRKIISQNTKEMLASLNEICALYPNLAAVPFEEDLDNILQRYHMDSNTSKHDRFKEDFQNQISSANKRLLTARGSLRSTLTRISNTLPNVLSFVDKEENEVTNILSDISFMNWMTIVTEEMAFHDRLATNPVLAKMYTEARLVHQKLDLEKSNVEDVLQSMQILQWGFKLSNSWIPLKVESPEEISIRAFAGFERWVNTKMAQLHAVHRPGAPLPIKDMVMLAAFSRPALWKRWGEMTIELDEKAAIVEKSFRQWLALEAKGQSLWGSKTHTAKHELGKRYDIGIKQTPQRESKDFI
ncbi:hypothetical protein BT63DRAFT_413371 [Microthyrium microscopicum]|uniref:Uncharacterized protein n=1 Tax=Microthyrium microscopicum TaxID=703497 RepID=A0A6A6UIG2_9PEZI|nr:hypothetical protein BT63DRAFT_413371 [Microthyrium microscopicum]